LDAFIAKFGYAGIMLVLILGGLGLPVPEEAPLILAAVLSRKGTMAWPIAFASCLIGVLVGDFVVYFLGFFYGEKVLSLPLTRKFLTKARETQIKGYFHRHGIKILILGRFAVGFRTAAYLTAGILKLPMLRLFLTDLCAATFSTTLMFGLGYVFARQIEDGVKEAQQWVTIAIAVGVVAWLLLRFYRARKRIGQLVGPPVLVDEGKGLPPDDLFLVIGPDEANQVPLAPFSSPEGSAPTNPSSTEETVIPARDETVTDSSLNSPTVPESREIELAREQPK
jgi:membrane protein DedA with SNARE-associated domain